MPMNSVDRHFRERERMKDLLIELSKRKPGGKTLRDMLTRMLNAHAAVGTQIANYADSVRGTCPCCVHAALGGSDSPYDKLLRKQERQASANCLDLRQTR
jgi:hypothetical protein